MSNLLDFCLLVVGYCEFADEDSFDNVSKEGVDKDKNPESEIVFWVASAFMELWAIMIYGVSCGSYAEINVVENCKHERIAGWYD